MSDAEFAAAQLSGYSIHIDVDLSLIHIYVDFGMLEINGTDSGIKISMPYLSGPTLCEISNKFGLPVTYGWNGGAHSRWAYLDDLLAL